MEPARRRLPHQYPEGKWLFVTWCLDGSFPHAMYPPAGKRNAGRAFVWMDRFLDTTRDGPMLLRLDELAGIVFAGMARGAEMGHYELGPWVIMANHVHVLLLPKIKPALLLRALKGTSARQINQALGQTGAPVWQRESYDHWVRDEREFDRIAAYIEENPVKAGLVQAPADYRWSSACVDKSVDAARKSACATNTRIVLP